MASVSDFSWEPPYRLTHLTNITAGFPKVAFGPDRTIYVTWVEVDGNSPKTRSNVFLQRRKRNGEWLNPISVVNDSDTDTEIVDPDTNVPTQTVQNAGLHVGTDGKVYVFWLQDGYLPTANLTSVICRRLGTPDDEDSYGTFEDKVVYQGAGDISVYNLAWDRFLARFWFTWITTTGNRVPQVSWIDPTDSAGSSVTFPTDRATYSFTNPPSGNSSQYRENIGIDVDSQGNVHMCFIGASEDEVYYAVRSRGAPETADELFAPETQVYADEGSASDDRDRCEIAANFVDDVAISLHRDVSTTDDQMIVLHRSRSGGPFVWNKISPNVSSSRGKPAIKSYSGKRGDFFVMYGQDSGTNATTGYYYNFSEGGTFDTSAANATPTEFGTDEPQQVGLSMRHIGRTPYGLGFQNPGVTEIACTGANRE